MLSSHEVQRSKRIIIATQCSGLIAFMLFNNGFLLNYLAKLGFQSSSVLICLSLPMLFIFLFLLPFAFASDIWGKKKVGYAGLCGCIMGCALITLAGMMPMKWRGGVIVGGIIFYGVGFTLFSSGWFALLEPIIQKSIRGRFFGHLRLSWHIVGILFMLVVTAILNHSSHLGVYRAILFIVTLCVVVQLICYRRIPELEKPSSEKQRFSASFRMILDIPGYVPFCAYTFLLMLFTGSCPLLFGLLEKDVLGFSESRIVLLGNILLMGSIVGFYFGGKLIDQFGPKMIFLICHIAFGVLLFGFVLRDFLPLPPLLGIGGLTALFGMVKAASNIAITTEMMALIPKSNKSLSSSFNFMLYNAGITLSGILSGKIVALNMLNPSWVLLGRTMSRYDSLLLGCGMMILLLIITLSLVPSVMVKREWMPRGV